MPYPFQGEGVGEGVEVGGGGRDGKGIGGGGGEETAIRSSSSTSQREGERPVIRSSSSTSQRAGEGAAHLYSSSSNIPSIFALFLPQFDYDDPLYSVFSTFTTNRPVLMPFRSGGGRCPLRLSPSPLTPCLHSHLQRGIIPTVLQSFIPLKDYLN